MWICDCAVASRIITNYYFSLLTLAKWMCANDFVCGTQFLFVVISRRMFVVYCFFFGWLKLADCLKEKKTNNNTSKNSDHIPIVVFLLAESSGRLLAVGKCCDSSMLTISWTKTGSLTKVFFAKISIWNNFWEGGYFLGNSYYIISYDLRVERRFRRWCNGASLKIKVVRYLIIVTPINR